MSDEKTLKKIETKLWSAEDDLLQTAKRLIVDYNNERKLQQKLINTSFEIFFYRSKLANLKKQTKESAADF